MDEITFLSRNINDKKLAFSFGCWKTSDIGNLKQHVIIKHNWNPEGWGLLKSPFRAQGDCDLWYLVRRVENVLQYPGLLVAEGTL